MTVQYNVNIVGNLVNSNGVLSGFSSSDYATITTPITFGTVWEINSKIHTGNSVSGLQVILCPNVDQEGVRIEFTNGVWGLLCGHNGEWINTTNYQGGTVSANTTYWLKATSDGAGSYSLKVSTDGVTYATAINYYGGNNVTSNFTSYVVGIYSDLSQGIYSGSVDLNESNIISDGSYVWQGVTGQGVNPKIQLRHDTAANWTSVNPVLLEGEVGIETDTRKQKFGDGSTAWNSLPYDVGSTALQSITSSDVTTALGYTPVNKAGDTMTGGLIISANSPYQGLRMNDTGQVAGTTPSSERNIGLRFYDNNGTYVGYIQNTYGTDGSRKLLLNCRNGAGNTGSSLVLGLNANNDFMSQLPSCQDNGSIVTTVSKNKAQNGYYKLGNGLIIQWGFLSQVSSAGSILFPTAFSSATSYSITSGLASSSASIYFSNASSTGINYTISGTKKDYYWVAVGY